MYEKQLKLRNENSQKSIKENILKFISIINKRKNRNNK